VRILRRKTSAQCDGLMSYQYMLSGNAVCRAHTILNELAYGEHQLFRRHDSDQ
jgi:hypothetical protein